MKDSPDNIDRGHSRETLRMLAQAVRNRWEIPEGMRSIAPKVAAKILIEGNNRERLRALEVLAALDRDNINALVAMDKLERLDTPDGVTEKQRIEVVYVDRIDTNRD
jgi:hypothetical protein